MDVNKKFTDIVGFESDQELSRSKAGDIDAFESGYALWAFAQAWKGAVLPNQPLTNNEIPVFDTSFYGAAEYSSYNVLFQRLNEWCYANYQSDLETKFPDLAIFFHNVANKWYIQTGLSVEDVPLGNYFDVYTEYEQSFLNPKVYYVVPPFFYNYAYLIQEGVATINISNNILVPLQRRGIDGKNYLIDTYPEILEPTYPLTMYRLLQLLLGYLSYEGQLSQEGSHNIAADFEIIKRCLFKGYPKLLYWDPNTLKDSSTVKTKVAANMNSAFSPVLLDRVIEYIKNEQRNLKEARSSNHRKTKKG